MFCENDTILNGLLQYFPWLNIIKIINFDDDKVKKDEKYFNAVFSHEY